MSSLVSLQAGWMRVLMARVRQLIGWSGLVGVALLVCAAVVLAMAWAKRDWATRHPMVANVPTPKQVPASDPMSKSSSSVEEQALPRHADIPLLVTQIEHAALANGLAWSAAEFRITAAAAQAPASLNVRCTLKGPYPKLRSMVAQLLTSVPGVTLRELNMTRPSSDVADVEGKLAIVVFLADEAPADGAVPEGSR